VKPFRTGWNQISSAGKLAHLQLSNFFSMFGHLFQKILRAKQNALPFPETNSNRTPEYGIFGHSKESAFTVNLNHQKKMDTSAG
jgi:hypothetical protein